MPPSAQALRRVMFSADDFGLSPALNNAVALAHRGGLLGNASLMPGAPAFPHAVALSRNFPALCLGVHLTLIQGAAILPPRQIPGLVDAAGRFPTDPVQTGWRYYFQTGLLPEIRAELRAQIEAVLRAGVTVWQLNSHLNLHLHPRLRPWWWAWPKNTAFLPCAWPKRTGLPPWPWPRTRPSPRRPWGSSSPCSAAGPGAWPEAAGLLVNDHLFGLTHHGRMTRDYLLGLVPRLSPGLTEIYSHPALAVDAALREAAPAYLRRQEFEALVSPDLEAALEAHVIEVTDLRAAVKRHRDRIGHFSP